MSKFYPLLKQLQTSKVVVFVVLVGVALVLSSNSNGRATQSNRGNTGAFGETTCGQCHSASTYGTVSLSIEIFEAGSSEPVEAYLPETTYDMRVTVSHTTGNPVGFGFQLTCLTEAENLPLAGFTNLAANVKQATLASGPQAGRTYVEHNGVTANPVFEFSWTAPESGFGPVRFFASGNAVNGNNGSSGDTAGATSLTLNEVEDEEEPEEPVNVLTVVEESLTVFPNPFTSQLTIELGLETARVRVFSLTGQLVEEVDQLRGRAFLETSAWPAGVYLLVIDTPAATITERLIKQ